MNRQYSLVNECLDLLREKDIDPIHALRIDVQLIRLKGLLLVQEMDEAEADSFMVTLRGICRKIANIGRGEGASAVSEEVIRDLQQLIDDLTKGGGLRRGGG